MQDVLFYCISGLIIASALAVVSLKNVLHAALALVATLSLSAALFILLHAEFVAAAQVLVYIGGVVIFMIFSILLTTKLGEKIEKPTKTAIGLGLCSSLCIFFLLIKVLPSLNTPAKASEPIAELAEVGKRLMSPADNGFIVPFEMISIVLLAALVGAIVIAKKDKEEEASS